MNRALFVIAAVLGMAAGLAFGYYVFAVRAPGSSMSFIVWATSHGSGRPREATLWALFGAAVALAIAYLTSRDSR